MKNIFFPRAAVNCTPSNTADNVGVGFYVGVAGDVTVEDEQGNTPTFTCPAGQQIILPIVKVKATGTTATGIVLYKQS